MLDLSQYASEASDYNILVEEIVDIIESTRNFKYYDHIIAEKELVESDPNGQSYNLYQDLSSKLNRLNKELVVAKNLSSADQSKIIKEIYDTRGRLDELLTDKRASAPSTSFAEIRKFDYQLYQSELDSDELVCSYFVGDESIYRIDLTTKSLEIHKIDFDKDLHQKITSLNAQVSRINDTDQLSPAEFYELSFGLAQQILPIELLHNFNSLTVVPDGLLGVIPFESLCVSGSSDPSSWSDLDYLIKNINVKYSTSLSIDAALMEKKNKYNANFISYVPTYEDVLGPDYIAYNISAAEELERFRDETVPLPGARRESHEIAKMWNGEVVGESIATISHFENNIKDYGQVHLAMHSYVNNDQPLLSFFLFDKDTSLVEDDGQLALSDIYNLDLNCQLVTLASCHSGSGEHKPGQGYLSLASAFFYAGAESVVQSLYRLSDGASNYLMKAFYEGLSKDDSKSQALRSAKLGWLDRPDIADRNKHPFYWSGLVLYGDDDPIHRSSAAFSPLWIVAGFFTLLLIVLLYKKLYSSREA